MDTSPPLQQDRDVLRWRLYRLDVDNAAHAGFLKVTRGQEGALIVAGEKTASFLETVTTATLQQVIDCRLHRWYPTVVPEGYLHDLR